MTENNSEMIKNRIYKVIKKKIINLDLKPGDVLSDRKLSEELRVSRTPVREALHLLQKENFVRQYPKRGFCVSEISLKNISDMYEVRRALEAAALRQAAKEFVPGEIEEIRQLLRHHEKIVKNFKAGSKFLEDAEFHKSFIRMSKNQYVIEIIESIFDRIQMLRNIEGVSQKRVKMAYQQHLQIFQHFNKGSYSKAEKMLSKHIEDSKNDFINRIKSRFEILYFEKRDEGTAEAGT
jgi:DNA-binding GntR family transcriptional regulator